ncbi:MAG: hypothetical protein ACKOKH_05345, partial [Bacteroidota bacterium]
MSKNGQVQGIHPNAYPKTLTQEGKRDCVDSQLQLDSPPNDQVEEGKSEPNDPNMPSPLHFSPETLRTETRPNQ